MNSPADYYPQTFTCSVCDREVTLNDMSERHHCRRKRVSLTTAQIRKIEGFEPHGDSPDHGIWWQLKYAIADALWGLDWTGVEAALLKGETPVQSKDVSILVTVSQKRLLDVILAPKGERKGLRVIKGGKL